MRWGRTASVAVLATFLAAEAASAAELRLTARAAMIMDAATGAVVWEQNANEPFPPASTTKVMTAILALESGRMDETLQVSSNAAATAPSKINLRPGQRMQLRSLLYALLLNSANDAATVIAEGLAGSEEAFAARMNARAQELGARTAHFVNPHGLTAPGHEASARDLAVIFRHGLQMPTFREMLSTARIRVSLEAPRVQYVALHSHNRLLTGAPYPVIGKTGYTRLARRCFVGAARRGNTEIIIALLGATDLWGDARRLVAYGLSLGEERPQVVMAGVMPIPRVVPRTVSEGDDEAAVEPANLRYAVQLGPYGSRRAVLATRGALARRGYSTSVAGRRLRVGPFESRATARRTAQRLRASGYNPSLIAIR
jgi:D-alanyl-D-alanine carboxypeptidase (penicillin-binding protein 5/6)